MCCMNSLGAQWHDGIVMLRYISLKIEILPDQTELSPKLWCRLNISFRVLLILLFQNLVDCSAIFKIVQ